MPLIRAANYSLFCEIALRIILFSTFCYMETMTPFNRYIQPLELETIYKYPRHDSFVPGGMLWAIVVSVPCLLSLLAWGVFNDCNDALEILLAWSLALGINGVVTDFVKLIAGRPRPDFFYRCFPTGVETSTMVCNGDPADIMEGRKSFPSGHSSLSFCSLGCASLWACGRLRVWARRGGGAGGVGGGGGAVGARLCAGGAPLLAAAAVALSRTCDHHHHWQDVLVGSILGFTLAVVCYRQYYNPLSSNLSGVPYIVSDNTQNNSKGDSPLLKCDNPESTPLLGPRKEDKWI